MSSTTVSTIDNGRQVPTADNLRSYLNGLGVPQVEQEAWACKRDQYAERADRLHPDLGEVRNRTRLGQVMLRALNGEQVDADAAWRRIREAGDDGPTMTRTAAQPSREELDAVLAGEPGALTEAVLPWIVYAAGGTRADISHWRDHFSRLPTEPAPPTRVDPSPMPGHTGATLEAQPLPVIPRQHPTKGAALAPSATAASGSLTRGSEPPAPGTPTSPNAASAAASAIAASPPPEASNKTLTGEVPPPFPSVERVPWTRSIPLKVWVSVITGSTAVLASLTVLAVVGVLHLDLRTRARHMAASMPDALATPLPEAPGGDAASILNQIATEILRSPQPLPTGVYAFVHRKSWTTDTTSISVAPNALAETITEERLWWSETAPGRRITTITEPGQGARSGAERLNIGPPTRIGPPTTDPDVLWQLLQHQYRPQLGPVRCLRAVTDLIDTHPLDTAHRAAVLRLLAGCGGVVARGQAHDRHDRSGITVSADHTAAHTRDTLIIDPATGTILAREVTRTDTTTPNPVVIAHTLYIDQSRTDQAG